MVYEKILMEWFIFIMNLKFKKDWCLYIDLHYISIYVK